MPTDTSYYPNYAFLRVIQHFLTDVSVKQHLGLILPIGLPSPQEFNWSCKKQNANNQILKENKTMKVNMMIKRALASSVAATMMLGGAVVMADETDDELEMTPIIVCTAAEEEPEAETIDEEQTDDAAYHTGDIIYITNESTSFSDGVYRVYISSLDYTTFTNSSFYKKNGQLIMSRGGINISLGSGYTGFRTIVSDNGTVELHPVTNADIEMYAASDAARQREMEEQLPTIDEHSIEEEAPADEQVPTVDVTPIVNVTLPPVVSTRPSAPAVSAAPAAAATLVATQSGTEGFVNRLYTSALGREADSTGFAHWVSILNSKELTGTEVANGFFNSAEFASRDLNNVEFVTVLYRVFFDREPDHNGLNYWVRSLQNGMTRQQVIAGFTGSSEWADTCAEFGIIA